MPFRDVYRDQVRLLVRVLPIIAEQKCFALKGGTAINLFVRDMPRLSVDIDLSYLPVQPRPQSLNAIDVAMKVIAKRIRESIDGSQVNEAKIEDTVITLYVNAKGVQIKIEVTPVLRGSVFEPQLRRVSEIVEQEFGFAEIQVVSFSDLYAGKIIAALDRQHPRDLLDSRDLLANEGISDDLRNAFLVYLLSHDRPMHEVVAPRRKNLETEFAHAFDGMTEEPVSLEELEKSREALIDTIVGQMPIEHREFLVAFVKGEEDWNSIGLPDAAKLPAIKWRQLNLAKLSTDRRAELADLLRKALEESSRVS
ncbi:MAG TPA: nucleotidyl transferase AbiEii/AbiGii toxin family protein [Rhizomicrobium sp.]|nr:nucleotidyl transferase AbiEii/AbiGii toxin family protein [Rhizomicrobium sp.]